MSMVFFDRAHKGWALWKIKPRASSGIVVSVGSGRLNIVRNKYFSYLEYPRMMNIIIGYFNLSSERL